MNSFRMQERDLDLFILEELHADTGFAEWLAGLLDLNGYRFVEGEHSVSAKVGAKWGETDVLAFFESGDARIAILIEDKIAANFQDRQAERYRERAEQIVAEAKAQAYRTVLIAPAIYLEGVPRDDPWDYRIAINDIALWFEQKTGPHAKWRAAALGRCLKDIRSNAASGNDDALIFSKRLSNLMREITSEFWHDSQQKGSTWGLAIKFSDRPSNVQLVWKPNQSVVDLEFYSSHVGKLANLDQQVGLIHRLSTEGEIESDSLRAHVGNVSWKQCPADQMEVVSEVIVACQRLRLLALEVTALPSVVQEAPQLP